MSKKYIFILPFIVTSLLCSCGRPDVQQNNSYKKIISDIPIIGNTQENETNIEENNNEYEDLSIYVLNSSDSDEIQNRFNYISTAWDLANEKYSIAVDNGESLFQYWSGASEFDTSNGWHISTSPINFENSFDYLINKQDLDLNNLNDFVAMAKTPQGIFYYSNIQDGELFKWNSVNDLSQEELSSISFLFDKWDFNILNSPNILWPFSFENSLLIESQYKDVLKHYDFINLSKCDIVPIVWKGYPMCFLIEDNIMTGILNGSPEDCTLCYQNTSDIINTIQLEELFKINEININD